MPLLNTLVRGDTETETDPEEVRILFDELRRVDGVEHAKASITDWEQYTHPGDPYPIPGKVEGTERSRSDVAKGDHGFMTDTTEDGWADRFISKVRERAATGTDETG